MKRAPWFVLLLPAFLISRPAGATTITSTTFGGWKTTLNGSPTEANFSPIQYTSYSTSQGITLTPSGNTSPNFTVTGPDGANWSLVGTNYSGLVSLESGSDPAAEMEITMPSAGVNAFLISLATINGDSMTVDLSDGESFSVGKGLLGFSISHPITWLTISTASGDNVILDDLWYGNSSLTQDSTGGTGGGSGSGGSAAAPEAATLLLTAGGVFFLFGAMRRVWSTSPRAA